jgi:hypothetical protein
MALQDAIRAFDAELRFRVVIPSMKKIDRAAARVESLADGLDAVDIEQIPEVVSVTTAALRNGILPDKRVTKLVAMGGLEEVASERDGKELVKTFFYQLKRDVSQRIIKALLVGYLRQNFKFPWLARWLRQFINHFSKFLPKRWRERIDDFDLLSETPGTTLAQYILEESAPAPMDILGKARLKGVLGQGGFSQKVFSLVCMDLGEGHTETRLQRFWEYVGNSPIRFSNHLPEYARALLGPYAYQTATELLKTDITHFLVDNFGDPRTRPGIWEAVSDEHITILKRWLTGQSFELLMQVVKQSNHTIQWKERVEFWQPYIDSGLVLEAWVALGRRAESVAKGMLREGLLKSRASYGTLQKGSVDSMHSVIFMRIGDIVVSEWTHSGKMRVYRKGNPDTPALYRNDYNVDNIRNDETCDHSIIHYSRWQGIAERAVKKFTGISRPSRQRRDTTRPSSSDWSRIVSCKTCHELVSVGELDNNKVCLSCRGIKVRTR